MATTPAPAKAAPAVVKATTPATPKVGSGRPGTLAISMSDADYNALPEELRNQISKSPSPKDSIGFFFDRMVANLKAKATPEERRFNVKDVLLWAYQQSNQRVFKIQSIRTVLKKRLADGQIKEATGTPGRDKVYEVVA
jgi:hypothetical protein